MMRYLITGMAGFIGFHLADYLCRSGVDVVGIDNLNSYYIQQLKQDRLAELNQYPNCRFYQGDLVDLDFLGGVFAEGFDVVVNLAAQAGVRYS
jgi:UDP-glucuronate 4-epimerase